VQITLGFSFNVRNLKWNVPRHKLERHIMSTLGPDYSFEQRAQARGLSIVAGVDEVGRGPLAGPVTAAAVILDPMRIPQGLNDSKKLSAKKRQALHDDLLLCADVSIAHASVEEIDELNILRASHLAMERAVAGLKQRPNHLLIDGNMIPRGLAGLSEAIVKGDSRSVSISAASIVAKICRDYVMWDLGQHYPGYGWETNAGYPSKSHKLALEKLGVTPHHRRSFKPVHNILYQEK
jgi:ribonuclease HII